MGGARLWAAVQALLLLLLLLLLGASACRPAAAAAALPAGGGRVPAVRCRGMSVALCRLYQLHLYKLRIIHSGLAGLGRPGAPAQQVLKGQGGGEREQVFAEIVDPTDRAGSGGGLGAAEVLAAIRDDAPPDADETTKPVDIISNLPTAQILREPSDTRSPSSQTESQVSEHSERDDATIGGLGDGDSRTDAGAEILRAQQDGGADSTQLTATVLNEQADSSSGVSVSGGLAVAGNLEVKTPFGSISVEKAGAHTLNKNRPGLWPAGRR